MFRCVIYTNKCFFTNDPSGVLSQCFWYCQSSVPHCHPWPATFFVLWRHLVVMATHDIKQKSTSNDTTGNTLTQVAMRRTAYLFDRYGPSTAYAVCFTVNALCLFTGFPWLQENKRVSQWLKRHTGEAKRGRHGVWGEPFGRDCACWRVCEVERETGGQMWERWGLVLWAICGETQHCKNKSLKRSLKLTDKQTSRTNSSNTNVQVQNNNKKKKYILH